MTGSKVAGDGQQERRWEFRAGQDGGRLDQFLAGKDTGLTRSRLHALIAEGYATLNGGVVKPSQKVRAGDVVRLTAPPPRSLDLSPEEIPLEIVYQDADVIVLDKPAGLPVHPGPGHPGGDAGQRFAGALPGHGRRRGGGAAGDSAPAGQGHFGADGGGQE